MLRHWGCAHEFGHWRLHLTSTVRLPDADERDRWRIRAMAHFAVAWAVAPRVTSIAAPEGPATGPVFRLLRRLPLVGAAGVAS